MSRSYGYVQGCIFPMKHNRYGMTLKGTSGSHLRHLKGPYRIIFPTRADQNTFSLSHERLFGVSKTSKQALQTPDVCDGYPRLADLQGGALNARKRNTWRKS